MIGLSVEEQLLADERDYRGILAHLHGFAQTASPERLHALVLALAEEALPHLAAVNTAHRQAAYNTDPPPGCRGCDTSRGADSTKRPDPE